MLLKTEAALQLRILDTIAAIRLSELLFIHLLIIYFNFSLASNNHTWIWSLLLDPMHLRLLCPPPHFPSMIQQ